MTPRDIAENLLGAIDWQGDGTGYCTCPGARFHTKGNSKRDCRVYVDDGVPTITCFHSSCSAEVETANHTLRSTIAKAEMKRDDAPARSPDSPMRVKSIHSYRQSRKPWETKTERDDINAKPATYNVENPDAIPAPMKDGTRELLRAAFEENEGVQICQARLNEEGHEVPDGFGVVLSRKEWLKQLDDCDGDPNGIFHSNSGAGIYIRVNPMKQGGRGRNEDVEAYRHALLEFDNISVEQQWTLITKSGIPCTAVIQSGGKSIHAWVKVDAENFQQFQERVALLYNHFASYKPDTQNKNPSRFSRLPNCRRFTKRQELLAIGIGTASWAEWLHKIEHDNLGESIGAMDLLDIDTTKDENCVIGFAKDLNGKPTITTRYLCKGKSAWIMGPSGVGKSSLVAEFAINWALGKPAFGIHPSRKLKILIIQAENDKADLAEMMQGICKAYDIKRNTPDGDTIGKNVRFITKTTGTGVKFLDWLAKILVREKPGIVFIDPLLSFAGINVNDQEECTKFLREGLNPILETTGVVMIGVHHTGKPKNAKDTANWTAIDHAYAGLGSSELVNWARAVMVLRPVTTSEFELLLAKRGKRAWATDLKGERTISVWLQHATSGIRWNQIDAPMADEPMEAKEPKRTKAEKLAWSNLHEFLAACPPTGEDATKCAKRLARFSMGEGLSVTARTCKDTVLDMLVESGKLAVNDAGKYVKGPNA